MDPWVVSSPSVKKVLREKEEGTLVPPVDQWRFPYLGLLLEKRQAAHYEAMDAEEKRITELLISLK